MPHIADSKYANLHLHTTYSDGALTPAQLCLIAKVLGYRALAVTDHNTVTCHAAFSRAAQEMGLSFLLGMEADVFEFGKSIHIVGYDFDPTAKQIAAYIQTRTAQAEAFTHAKLQAAHKAGLWQEITWQDVLGHAPAPDCYLCNEHIFTALIALCGYTQEDYWSFQRQFAALPVTDLPTFHRYGTREVISAIREAGGVASLAHPHNITHLLPDLYAYGLNCVEYDHPDIDQADASAAQAFARDHRMYLSGGTDHTGLLSNYALLRGPHYDLQGGGFLTPLETDVRCGVTEEEFLALKERVYG